MERSESDIAPIRPLEHGGFTLPSTQLGVSDEQRQQASLETLKDFIGRHHRDNTLVAERNAASLSAGGALQEFTMISLVETADTLVTRLAGRPAGAWWDDHLPVVTVCVQVGSADFALLLGQEFWPLAEVPSSGRGIYAASFFVPDAQHADLVLNIHVAHDHQSVLDQPFATCTASGFRSDASDLRPFAWRHGTTVICEPPEVPFPGARQFTHYCDGISATSPHIVIADGDLVWTAAQWLSALAANGSIPPVVVTGLIPSEPGSWSSYREELLDRTNSPGGVAFGHAVDTAVASLGTVTDSTPVVFAGFSVGGVWAIDHALRSPWANAALGHALCGPVDVCPPIRRDLGIRIVACSLDPSSRQWCPEAAEALGSVGINPQVTTMPTRHSWEMFVIAVSDFVRDLTGHSQA